MCGISDLLSLSNKKFESRCISIFGLVPNSREERVLRKSLAKSLKRIFPSKTPTACCCISYDRGLYEAQVLLYQCDRTAQLTFGASTLSELEQLFEDIIPVFRDSSQRLSDMEIPRMCRDCPLRRAHCFMNRELPYLNPNNRPTLKERLSTFWDKPKHR